MLFKVEIYSYGFQNGDFWNQLTNSGIVSAQTTVRYGRFQAQEDHLFS